MDSRRRLRRIAAPVAFRLRPLVFLWVFDDDVAMQSTPGGPLALDSRAAWLYDGQKVVHDAVRHGLVKDTLVAKSLQVHFEAL